MNAPILSRSKSILTTSKLKRNKPVLHFKTFPNTNNATGASLYIDTLDISVDMLKRILVKDTFAMTQLGLALAQNTVDELLLGNNKQFNIGRVENHSFVPFTFSSSLKDCKINSNDTLWIQVCDK
jgi:hypothetical protein